MDATTDSTVDSSSVCKTEGLEATIKQTRTETNRAVSHSRTRGQSSSYTSARARNPNHVDRPGHPRTTIEVLQDGKCVPGICHMTLNVSRCWRFTGSTLTEVH